MKRQRERHAQLAFNLASYDRRLLDLITQRPHLLNPYPSILTRLSRRSRRFRRRALPQLEGLLLLPGGGRSRR
jgi:hypothetical protein